MRKILALCCTYYQLIVVMQLKNSILKDCKITVLLTDDSKDAEKIVENLNSLHYFENVLLIKKKDIRISIRKRLSLVRRCVWSSNELEMISDAIYDDFFFYNFDIFAFSIFASIENKNPQIRTHVFEEGLISYYAVKNFRKKNLTKKYRIINFLRNIQGKRSMVNINTDFYCFFPKLYEGEMESVAIPHIDKNDNVFVEILAKAFNCRSNIEQYSQKYIFLSSMIDSEGNGVPGGEASIARRLADVVGDDNFLVKVHPRDDIEKYENLGLNIDADSYIPFEVKQLVYDFSDKVFITTLSGAVLTISSIIKNQPRIVFVYKLYPCEIEYLSVWGSKYEELSEKLEEYNIIDNISFIENAEDLV